MSPTARSLAQLRADGFLAEVVEKWIPRANVRRDLFGFADILAIHPELHGVLAIQACVTGDMPKRLRKIEAEPKAVVWCQAGNAIAVWGWAKRGPRGKRKTWALSMTPVLMPGVTGRVEERG